MKIKYCFLKEAFYISIKICILHPLFSLVFCKINKKGGINSAPSFWLHVKIYHSGIFAMAWDDDNHVEQDLDSKVGIPNFLLSCLAVQVRKLSLRKITTFLLTNAGHLTTRNWSRSFNFWQPTPVVIAWSDWMCHDSLHQKSSFRHSITLFWSTDQSFSSRIDGLWLTSKIYFAFPVRFRWRNGFFLWWAKICRLLNVNVCCHPRVSVLPDPVPSELSLFCWRYLRTADLHQCS